jgi:G3E family GTPase
MTDDIVATTPVSVITGFLGSGKTTLLARLLRNPALRDTAVIVNELGEIGLDHHLVEAQTSQEVVLLDQGCLCCALNSDLTGTLLSLYNRRSSGAVPAFKRVVVETTGLADPAPVLQTLLDEKALYLDYRLDSVVATVDALQGALTLDSHRESVKQAAVADRIVLTKTDIAPGPAVADLRTRLAAINPSASIFAASFGEIAPDRLFDAGGFDLATKTLDVKRWFGEIEHEKAHGHGHHHHRHDDGIRTASFAFDGPIAFDRFADWLTRLVADHGDRLLRVKGIVAIAGQDRPIVVHGVQHVFHPPVRLAAWPSEDRRSRLVFIARELDRAFFQQKLEEAGFV